MVEIADLSLELAQVTAEAFERIADVNMAAEQPPEMSAESRH